MQKQCTVRYYRADRTLKPAIRGIQITPPGLRLLKSSLETRINAAAARPTSPRDIRKVLPTDPAKYSRMHIYTVNREAVHRTENPIRILLLMKISSCVFYKIALADSIIAKINSVIKKNLPVRGVDFFFRIFTCRFSQCRVVFHAFTAVWPSAHFTQGAKNRAYRL